MVGIWRNCDYIVYDKVKETYFANSILLAND